MNKIISIPQKDGLGRDLFYLFLPDFKEFPTHLELPSKNFGLLFACDVTSVKGEILLSWADNLIDNGLVYFCAWGKGSQETENAVDIACVEKKMRGEVDDNNNGYFVMTTSHDDEPLNEALWFALNLSYPDEKYVKDCESNLIIVVENKDWHKQILAGLSDVESFNKIMVEEETDNEPLTTDN